MEVNNPMMEQLPVNAPATSAGAKPAKDAEKPDFDSMVHQKRSAGEKAEAKDAKPEKAEARDAAEGEAAETRESVSDERYAIAAAMMFQAQPDARYAAIQSEAAEAAESVPELAVEAARTVGAEASVELPEATIAAEAPAEPIAQAAPEAAELAARTVTEAPEAPAAAETPVETRREAPAAEMRSEAPREAEPERAAPTENAPRAEQTEAPREAEPERAERPRVARVEARPETEGDETDTAAAQTMPETPLFERVEAPVVKVAEASRPIPLDAEGGVEQLGNEIENIVVNDVDANRVEVTLTPEHLGKLTVEITRGADGTLNVVLHATTERAANLLEKGVDGLRQALAADGGREARIEVRGGEEAQRQFLNPDGQNEQNRGQQQQRQSGRRGEQRGAQEFLQQLRLGLVGIDEGNE